jgi:hypothetical protein
LAPLAISPNIISRPAWELRHLRRNALVFVDALALPRFKASILHRRCCRRDDFSIVRRLPIQYYLSTAIGVDLVIIGKAAYLPTP